MKARLTVGFVGVSGIRLPGEIVEGAEATELLALGFAELIPEFETAKKTIPNKETATARKPK